MNNDIQEITNEVSDEWKQYDGLPEYSAEFSNGEFDISIHHTNCYEVTLHHPSGEDTGKDGYYKPNVLESVNCNTVQFAKVAAKSFSNNPDSYLE